MYYTLKWAETENIAKQLKTKLHSENLLRSDGNHGCPATALGMSHEMVNLANGERVRGAVHTIEGQQPAS